MNQTVDLTIFLLVLNKGNRHFWNRELQLQSKDVKVRLFRKGKKLLKHLDKSPGLVIIDGYFAHPKSNDVSIESVYQHLIEHAPELPLFLVSPNSEEKGFSIANRPAMAYSGALSHELLQTLHYQIEHLQAKAA